MEQKQLATSGAPCKVCIHPDVQEIHDELLKGTPVSYLPTKFAGAFSRFTIHKHIKDCLNKSGMEFRENARIETAHDLMQRFSFLLKEIEEMYFAAKQVVIVGKEVNLNPRAWEISVVYLDYTDINEHTGEPTQKTDTLDKLLSQLHESGKRPQHTFIKSEDPRKVILKVMDRIESILDKYARYFGVYQRERNNIADEYKAIQDTIRRTADKLGTSYLSELHIYLADAGQQLRADLRGMLLKESQDTPTPLPAAGWEVKALPPSPSSATDSPEKIIETTGKVIE